MWPKIILYVAQNFLKGHKTLIMPTCSTACHTKANTHTANSSKKFSKVFSFFSFFCLYRRQLCVTYSKMSNKFVLFALVDVDAASSAALSPLIWPS